MAVETRQGRTPFRGWMIAPGGRVQHFYAQGCAAMTYALCYKKCIVDSLKSHAGFSYCKTCWGRLPKYTAEQQEYESREGAPLPAQNKGNPDVSSVGTRKSPGNSHSG